MITAAGKLGPGETGLIRFRVAAPGESEPHVRHVRFALHTAFDWLIAVGLDEEEMLAPVQALDARLREAQLVEEVRRRVVRQLAVARGRGLRAARAAREQRVAARRE